MAAAELIHIQRMTGAALVASFIVFAIGGILPIVGEHENVRIFSLPVREHCWRSPTTRPSGAGRMCAWAPQPSSSWPD